MPTDQDYILTMNKAIKNLVGNAIKVSLRKPAFSKFIVKNLLWQSTAEKLRAEWEKKGYHIPAFLIASITSQCNLTCTGCYDRINSSKCTQELTTQRWLEVFTEAKELGISFILIAGGEPFIREDLLKLLGKIPEIIFPIFTNGTHIDEHTIHILEGSRNLIPIISLEGYENDTDARRGEGIYQTILQGMDALSHKNIFFGTSITVTCENFDLVTSTEFVNNFIQKGCKSFLYVEYVPIDGKTEHLEISSSQRLKLAKVLLQLRENYASLFISFPGDENQMGGCLSSGRGFVHINASGDLEPCPFSPYSDVNLFQINLKEALQSKFLKSIRDSNEHLSETEHGCALFHKKDWVQSLLK
ncbi:MAG: radical SAM protein [Firmicutes bacterium HGW-Firmicutes-1]|jgi:MoaA/NifB/PqqE/SkfB family radical SAM enzyme|nr:MAG: radical SAM protein [Firmicutes bacterium HGW-Firmicutes-1]